MTRLADGDDEMAFASAEEDSVGGVVVTTGVLEETVEEFCGDSVDASE